MINTNIEELIKENYDSLSAGKKQVAKYVLSHIEEVSYSTISQLQKKIGVRETTIIRFSYELGFSAYSEMQRAIQSEILSRSNSDTPIKADSYTATDKEKYAEIINKDIEILEQTIKELDISKLEKASELITNADKILVLGHHTSYASAYWFSSTLGLMLPSVTLLDQQNTYQELLNLTDDSVIVSISFPRYRKETYETTKKVAKANGKVIAITDSDLSPISRISDVSLQTKTNRDDSGYNAISPVISLLNILIVSVREQNEKLINSRLLKLESYYDKDDTVYE